MAHAAEVLGLELDGDAPRDTPQGDCVGQLPGGWVLAWTEDFDALRKGRFAPLLKFGPAVGCAVDEHVMVQEARGYRDGAEVWRITHDPNEDEGVYSLDVAGEPPANFAALRSAAIKAQDAEGGEDAQVDLISDVPLDVARSICGFKHDEAPPEGTTFMGLRRARKPGAARPGFFARLFGAR
ncbi:hypothetical protein [uncultured Phenylobacterium sp.]|uniref:hypothetical protein n=1 Tax=uncultured Phenylobacterium sp. TaxID=349273 RepID=UPI0025D9AAA3|nr:hypothetical protein [uncultured Phenylobacterium sp.]